MDGDVNNGVGADADAGADAGGSGSGLALAQAATARLVQRHEVRRHTGNASALRAAWPSVVKAIRWCVANANGTDGYGLPQYLTNTYLPQKLKDADWI